MSKMVGAGRSEPRSCVGTRPYMAPEVEEGHSYDFSSDVWCLGVLLFVLIVGKFPFDAAPRQQNEINLSMQRIRRSATAKGIMSGLLQWEPLHRPTLDALLCLEWRRGSESEPEAPEEASQPDADRGPKRQRIESSV
uniref:Protein kinase domain-containing protein n=1 Tax=Spumella elongata TaxID=89044 RepID=A0A7S3MAV0_9STRA